MRQSLDVVRIGAQNSLNWGLCTRCAIVTTYANGQEKLGDQVRRPLTILQNSITSSIHLKSTAALWTYQYSCVALVSAIFRYNQIGKKENNTRLNWTGYSMEMSFVGRESLLCSTKMGFICRQGNLYGHDLCYSVKELIKIIWPWLRHIMGGFHFTASLLMWRIDCFVSFSRTHCSNLFWDDMASIYLHMYHQIILFT